MEYDLSHQVAYDIDWVMCDRFGNLAVCASGAGPLPIPVARSQERNELLVNYILGIPKVGEAVFNPDICNWSPSFELKNEPNCHESWGHYAERGFFVFDNAAPGYWENTTYVLLYSPSIKIQMQDLPSDIQQLLMETCIEKDISTASTFDLNEVKDNAT